MTTIFLKKIEKLFKEKHFKQIEFEIDCLNEKDKKNPFFYNLLGVIKIHEKKIREAQFFFKEALKLDEFYIHSLLNLSKISFQLNDYEKIISLLKNYYEKKSPDFKILECLADLTFAAGHVKDSLFYHKSIAESQNCKIRDLSAFLSLQEYTFDFSQKEYFKYCEKLNKILNKKNEEKIIINDFKKNKVIGFLSADLKYHPVAYFLKDIIKELKNLDCETFGLSLVDEKDENNKITQELKENFSHWINVKNFDDNKIKELIKEKKINILIDLMGHSAENRIEIFKKKIAPIQISWLGYCNSTGIKEMDYIIADPYTIKKENENFFSEKILRLPNIWSSHSIIEDVPVNELPFIKNKYFTFGSFNNFRKISDENIEVWSKILRQVKKSKLLLKSYSRLDINYKKYLLDKFEKFKVNKQIYFMDITHDREKHLAMYNEVDLSLDTFPYNGGNTSFESIWMGVPVLTLSGEKFVSRYGTSINSNLKLNDFISKDTNDYILKAVKFSSINNCDELNNLRKNLRQKSINSPLFDNKNFAINFINALNL